MGDIEKLRKGASCTPLPVAAAGGKGLPPIRCGGESQGILNPAEQARQQTALRSRWSLCIGSKGVILRFERGSHPISPHQQKTPRTSRGVFCCERTVKRCVNAGKNSKKYTRTLLDKLEFIKFIFYINNVKLFRLLVCICFLFRKGLHSTLLGLQTSSNQLPQRLPSIFQHLHKDKTSDHPSNLDNAPSNNYNRVLKNCIVHHS